MEDLFPIGERGRPVYADGHVVVTRTVDPAGLHIAGEIDISNSDAFAHSMRLALAEGEHPHLDLSGLIFSDVSGIRALVELAEGLGAGRTVLLHGPPRQLQILMRVAGWSERPCLALCECAGVSS